jgi:hypothetical protein
MRQRGNAGWDGAEAHSSLSFSLAAAAITEELGNVPVGQ